MSTDIGIEKLDANNPGSRCIASWVGTNPPLPGIQTDSDRCLYSLELLPIVVFLTAFFWEMWNYYSYPK